MRRTIAIVDDDAASLTAIGALVEAFGYRARCFADPASFLSCGAAREVDALIADMRLPECSGLMLCRRLRAAGIELPAVLVTAWPDEATRRIARSLGLHGYLAKPVTPEELLECLRHATGKVQGG